MLFFGLIFASFTVISVEMSRTHAIVLRGAGAEFSARGIAESALARGIAELKRGGQATPLSGGGATAEWVPFDEGDYFYSSSVDATGKVTTIQAWGRVALDSTPSSSTVAPDSASWDGSGWMVRGLEVTIVSTKHIPDAPIYVGNGGIQAPLGGFAWTGGSDPLDPSSWGVVTSRPHSYQDSSIPFEISALRHPADYLDSGGSPEAATERPHPHPILVSQNPIAQFNTMAWFDKSAGAGVQPDSILQPDPTSTFYEVLDSSSDSHPYAVDSGLPDAQEFAYSLWNREQGSSDAYFLNGGNLSGTYGTTADPRVTFVTGELDVPAGRTFKGAGILVIRDDYDPNTDTNNTPRTNASLRVRGTLEWTGMVIVTGWNPSVQTTATGSATIVGAFLAEDSVQSMGEISLDSSAVIFRINGPFRILYSQELFDEKSPLYPKLPDVERTIVGIRDL